METVQAPQTVQETLAWLTKNGYPALPVAPRQAGNPKFTGKNPSYLDAKGIPHLVPHKDYQKRLPSQQELHKWFANPANGVGTLGGWNNTVWLDFDVKQFQSQQECDVAVQKILSLPELQQTFIERSHSGGWRIGVRCENPGFTNFALEPGGKHVGEALACGRFTVLAPTVGVSGNPYISIHRALPVEISSLEFIGIHSTSPQKTHLPQTPQTLTTGYVPGSIPLEMLGTSLSNEVLRGVNNSGDRSKELTTAIHEWYGWANWCTTNGIPTTGTPEELAHQAGNALGIDPKRVDRILKTIDPATRTPAAQNNGGDEACWKKIWKIDQAVFDAKCPVHIMTAIKREWGHGDKPSGTAFGSGINSGVPELSCSEQLTELVQRGTSGSALTETINQIATKTKRHPIELRKQYNEILEEQERQELREDTAAQVERLLDAAAASINLHEILPTAIATPLINLAGWLNLKPETYLTVLLTTASTLHHPKSRVILNGKMEFEVSPGLYSAIIAPSSQKKSPIFKAIAQKPLRRLQATALEEFKLEKAAYEEALAEWESKKAGDRGNKPEEPVRKIYFFTKTTGEGLTGQAARCPAQGMLYLSDELNAIMNSQNQYRGNKGSDKQDLLSYYDGTGDVVLRADGVKADFDSILLGVTGGIQPKVIQSLLEDCSDADGAWARFIFVNQPNSASRMDDSDGSYDLTGLLEDLYRKIDTLPETTYRLSPAAFKLFAQAYNGLEQKRANDPLEGMQSVWGKSEGRIGKLALTLHCIHAILAGESSPSAVIGEASIRQAIILCRFYANQVHSLYTQFSEPEAIAPHLVKVLEFAQKKGDWIKASDVVHSLDKKNRPSSATVRGWFLELIAMKKGESQGEGRSLQFKRFGESVVKFGESVVKTPHIESTQYQYIEEKCGVCGESGDFSEVVPEAKISKVSLENFDEEKVDFFSNSPQTPHIGSNPVTASKKSVVSSPQSSPHFPQTTTKPDDTTLEELEAQYGYPQISSLDSSLDVEPTPMISNGHATSTEPFSDEATKIVPKTPLDELKEKLSHVTFWGEFSAATVGFRSEEIEAAIAAQSPEVQVRLQAWLQESSDENVRIE